MSNYKINQNNKENIQTANAYFNMFQIVHDTGTLIKNDGMQIKYNISYYGDNFNIETYKTTELTQNNDARSIAINWTPKAIREFKFSQLTNSFATGYPINNSYDLCNQKLSIVYSIGPYHHISRDETNKTSSVIENNVNDPLECALTPTPTPTATATPTPTATATPTPTATATPTPTPTPTIPCETPDATCVASSCSVVVDECEPRAVISGISLGEMTSDGQIKFNISFDENKNCYKNISYSITGLPWSILKKYKYYKNINNIYFTNEIGSSSNPEPAFLTVDSIGISNSYGCYGMMGNIPEMTEEIIIGQPPLDSGIINGIYLSSPSGIASGLITFASFGSGEGYSLDQNPGLRLASYQNPLNYSCFVSVCDTGNSPYVYNETEEFGQVNYGYQIQKFELTIEEYLEFLNTCFKTDPNDQGYIAVNNDCGLWPSNIGYVSGVNIVRSGMDGNYVYSIVGGSKPTGIYLKLPAPIPGILALRMCNWLHNKTVDPLTTYTDDGAYNLENIIPYSTDCVNPIYGYVLSGEYTRIPIINRRPCAKYFLPNNNEWFKAAFYKSSGTDSGYWSVGNKTDGFEGISTAECDGSSIDPDAHLCISEVSGCIPAMKCRTEDYIGLRFNCYSSVCVTPPPPTPPPTLPPTPTPSPSPPPTQPPTSPPTPTPTPPDYSDF